MPAITRKEALARRFDLWNDLRRHRCLDARRDRSRGCSPEVIIGQLIYALCSGDGYLAGSEALNDDPLARAAPAGLRHRLSPSVLVARAAHQARRAEMLPPAGRSCSRYGFSLRQSSVPHLEGSFPPRSPLIPPSTPCNDRGPHALTTMQLSQGSNSAKHAEKN